MAETPLDMAHAAMKAAPTDDAARLRYFERIADAELFLLLREEACGDQIKPEIFETGAHRLVLAFDREERLAEFVGGSAPYAALSGRAIAALLAGQGLGLGLNFDVAPSSFMLDAQGVAWLAETLGHAPEQVESMFAEFSAPAGLPESLITALDTKLAAAAGLARSAYLVGTKSKSGVSGHLLGFVDALEEAEDALAKAVSEALTFSGIEAGVLDVGFFAASDGVTARLARCGLRFDLPQQETTGIGDQPAPGSDPDKPPILK